jgi:putative methyltransferase (TIGR04325 family)
MRLPLREFIPPALKPLARRVRGRSVRFEGNYLTWCDARGRSAGYDSAEILARVTAGVKKVLAGEAAFERDSVCFEEPEYRWPLLASLMWIAARSNGELSVVDFGGSLGSSFLQNREFLRGLARVRWQVVEQPSFVERGRELFREGQPEFYLSAEECLRDGPAQVLVLSSVLQYLEDPHQLLCQLLSHRFQYVIVDKTPCMTNGSRDRLTLQTVPPSIYPATYPCWFLSCDRLLRHFQPEYRIVADLPCGDEVLINGGRYRGFLFARKCDSNSPA